MAKTLKLSNKTRVIDTTPEIETPETILGWIVDWAEEWGLNAVDHRDQSQVDDFIAQARVALGRD